MGTISDCLHLQVNSQKKIYLYVNSPTQRCQNKILKTFLIELRISPRIFEKFETALIGDSGAWGKLSHEKNLLKSKSRGTVPLIGVSTLHRTYSICKHILTVFLKIKHNVKEPTWLVSNLVGSRAGSIQNQGEPTNQTICPYRWNHDLFSRNKISIYFVFIEESELKGNKIFSMQ
jgi:hypothetical protein